MTEAGLYEKHADLQRFSHPVLVVTQAYPPLGSGSSTIMKNLLDGLDPRSVVLAVQKPPQERERLAPKTIHQRHFVERTSRLPGRIEQIRKRLSRPFVQGRIVALGRYHGCRAVVGVYPDLFFLDAACRAAQKLRVPFIPYLHDTVAESLSSSRLAKYAERVQKEVFKSPSCVLVATKGMAELYRKKYFINAVPIVHIYPEPIPDQPPSRPGSRRLFWAGNIYDINSAAVRRVYESLITIPGVEFTIASLQARKGLVAMGIFGDRVRQTYIPVRERSRYLDLLQEHGVLVLGLSWPDETHIHEDELRTIFPTKTPEYLASGRPILVHCPEHYYLARFFREHGCGVVVSERHPGKLVETLRALLVDSTLQVRLGKAALVASEQFKANSVVPLFHRSVQKHIATH